MSSDNDDEGDSTTNLLEITNEVEDTEDSSVKLLHDSDTERHAPSDEDETEHEASDVEDNEESVHELLRALVDGEEQKLGKRSKKSVEGSKHSNTEEGSQLDNNEDELDLGESVANSDDLRKVRLTLNIPDSSALLPSGSLGKRPISARVLENNIRVQKLLKEHSSEKSKAACGLFCIVFIFGIGVGMLMLAYLLKVNDLFIVGGIFTLGGVMFTLGVIIVRCMAKADLKKTDYSVLYDKHASNV